MCYASRFNGVTYLPFSILLFPIAAGISIVLAAVMLWQM